MTALMMNGAPRANLAPRKSLNQQLDRLDQILDGLSEGLQAAVVDAVREAVGEAVKAALREVLSSPELTARLAPASISPPVASFAAEATPNSTKTRPTGANRLWSVVRSRAIGLRNRLADFFGETRQAVKQTAVRLKRMARFSWTLMRYNVSAVVLALFVGVVAGTGCYIAGPLVAAVASGIATAILAGLARILAPFTGALMMDVEA